MANKFSDVSVVENVPTSSTKTKKIKTYPTVTVEVEDFPALDEKKIGEECEIVVRAVKVKDGFKDEWPQPPPDKRTRVATLEIRGMAEEDDDKDKMPMKGKMKTGKEVKEMY